MPPHKPSSPNATIDALEKLAADDGVETHRYSILLGYLFGRAACDDRRLLTDLDHLRAWARPILKRLPRL